MTTPLLNDLTVNGEIVSRARIAAEAQMHPAPKGKPGIAWRAAANALALRTVLLQEARSHGISAEPAEIGPGRFETGEEALIRGLLETAVAVAPPTEEAIRAEWLRDPSRFKSPPLWEVSHILISCDHGDDKGSAAACAEAARLCAAAQGLSPARFAALAAETSECPSRGQGGRIGQVGPRATEPPFEAALRRLSEGEVTAEPVATRHGWHVIRLDAVAEGRPLPFDTVRPAIAEALERRAWDMAARAYARDLVARATISGAVIGADAD